MKNIGQYFKETRENLGVTIKKASSETKIRVHILNNFEKNNFEINLPKVYLLGFMKIYARYLNISAGQISRYCQKNSISDCSSQIFTGKNKTKSFGSIYDNIDKNYRSKLSNSYKLEKKHFLFEKINIDEYSKYLKKLAIIFLIFSIFVSTSTCFTLVNRGDFFKNYINKTHQNSPELVYSTTNVINEKVSFKTNEEVDVVVRQESGRKRLLTGTINKGQIVQLRKRGLIKIHFSRGVGLNIEQNGRFYSMNTVGSAVRTLD